MADDRLHEAVRDLLHDGNPTQRLKMLADAHPETWGRIARENGSAQP